MHALNSLFEEISKLTRNPSHSPAAALPFSPAQTRVVRDTIQQERGEPVIDDLEVRELDVILRDLNSETRDLQRDGELERFGFYLDPLARGRHRTAREVDDEMDLLIREGAPKRPSSSADIELCVRQLKREAFQALREMRALSAQKEDALLKARTEIDPLKEQLETLASVNQSLRGKNAELRMQKRTAETNNKAISTELDRTSNALKEEGAERQKIEAEYRAQSEQLAQLQQAYRQLQKENLQLQAQYPVENPAPLQQERRPAAAMSEQSEEEVHPVEAQGHNTTRARSVYESLPEEEDDEVPTLSPEEMYEILGEMTEEEIMQTIQKEAEEVDASEEEVNLALNSYRATRK